MVMKKTSSGSHKFKLRVATVRVRHHGAASVASKQYAAAVQSKQCRIQMPRKVSLRAPAAHSWTLVPTGATACSASIVVATRKRLLAWCQHRTRPQAGAITPLRRIHAGKFPAADGTQSKAFHRDESGSGGTARTCRCGAHYHTHYRAARL
eukprot:6131778-Prymnesium_polylepis.1